MLDGMQRNEVEEDGKTQAKTWETEGGEVRRKRKRVRAPRQLALRSSQRGEVQVRVMETWGEEQGYAPTIYASPKQALTGEVKSHFTQKLQSLSPGTEQLDHQGCFIERSWE